jgi:hypothetical protein
MVEYNDDDDDCNSVDHSNEGDDINVDDEDADNQDDCDVNGNELGDDVPTAVHKEACCEDADIESFAKSRNSSASGPTQRPAAGMVPQTLDTSETPTLPTLTTLPSSNKNPDHSPQHTNLPAPLRTNIISPPVVPARTVPTFNNNTNHTPPHTTNLPESIRTDIVMPPTVPDPTEPPTGTGSSDKALSKTAPKQSAKQKSTTRKDAPGRKKVAKLTKTCPMNQGGTAEQGVPPPAEIDPQPNGQVIFPQLHEFLSFAHYMFYLFSPLYIHFMNTVRNYRPTKLSTSAILTSQPPRRKVNCGEAR